jgi:hypothetical protein
LRDRICDFIEENRKFMSWRLHATTLLLPNLLKRERSETHRLEDGPALPAPVSVAAVWAIRRLMTMNLSKNAWSKKLALHTTGARCAFVRGILRRTLATNGKQRNKIYFHVAVWAV